MRAFEAAALALVVAAAILAGIALWRRLAGDAWGAVAALVGVLLAAAGAVWALLSGQRKQLLDAEEAAEAAADRARAEAVRADVARIEAAETRDLTAIQVDTARDVTRIEIDGEHARATGPAAGELEAILAAYKKEHPDG